MKSTLLAIVFLCCFTLPAAAAAPTWGLLPGSSEGNVPSNMLPAVGALLDQSLTENGVKILSGYGNPTQQVLFSKGAEACVRYSLIGIGNTLKVSVQLIDPDGQPRAAYSLNSATPDDLDSVCSRLARALVDREPPREAETIYDVTEDEQDPLAKKKSTTYYGLKIIGVTGLTSGLSRAPLKFGAGAFALFDTRFFLAEFFGHMVGGSKDDFHEFSVEVGAAGYYPFSKKTLCPYAGLGVGLAARSAAWSGRDTNMDGGLTVSGALGLMLGRTSDIMLRTELRYVVDTFEVDKEFSSGIMYFLALGW